MLTEVTQEFDAYIATKLSSKKNVRDFILKHERKHICIEKLCDQIRMAEIGVKMDVNKWKMCIHSAANMFANACLRHKEEELLSNAEKQRRLDEANHIESCKELIQELEDDALDETPKSFLNDATR